MSPGGRLIAITVLPVIIGASLVMQWADSQPNTNHVANFCALVSVAAYGVVVISWWARR